MDEKRFSAPLPLRAVRVTDPFWQREMRLVRDEVIPYQWEALNDRVPGAAPSWWMHNMRAAARAVRAKRDGLAFKPKGMTTFETLPPDGTAPDPDAFYGFLFQDSDGYKWIEAVSYQLMLEPDEGLRATAQQAVDAICAAQEDDGYLDTYYTLNGRERSFTDLKNNHELYCLGHLAEAAVAWHQATGGTDLLQAAERFADCVARRIGRGPGLLPGYPGHEIAEMALIRLWEETGEERFLRQAEYFLDERGRTPNFFAAEENARRRAQGLPEKEIDPRQYAYNQAHVPVREQDEALGHAVRAMYLYSGMADSARLRRDGALWEACLRLWRSTAEEKMYVTGGVGATHMGEAFSAPFDLPNDTAYSETCAAIGLAFFARRMLQCDPDSRFADVMERALYNTVLAGMALDGRSFFYVNPLETDPALCRTDERLRHVKPVRQKWFGCACCPPNIARIVSSLPQYAMTASRDTLYLHLYVSGEADVTLGGGAVTVRTEANMPWEGRASVRIARGEAAGTIALRVPAWSREPVIASPGKARREEKGYVYLTGEWREGDVITVDLPMPVRIVKADPRVREAAGRVAFCRGLLVYCAEGADNGEDIQLLRVKPEEAAAPGAVTVRPCVIGGMPMNALTVPGRRAAPAQSLYADWTPDDGTPVPVTLIPYFAWANRGEHAMSVWLRTAGG